MNGSRSPRRGRWFDKNRRETPRLGGRSAPWLLTRDDYAGRGSELRKEERVSETGGEAVKEGAIERRRKSQHAKTWRDSVRTKEQQACVTKAQGASWSMLFRTTDGTR